MDFPIDLSLRHRQKAAELNIDPADIEEQFIRGGGAGGQKINKTSNCVWLKHGPTGIEVKCQANRDRLANRKTAYKLLIDKIEEVLKGAESEREQKRFKVRKQKARRTRKSKEKMLDAKRQRGTLKESRQPPTLPEE